MTGLGQRFKVQLGFIPNRFRIGFWGCRASPEGYAS